MGGAVEWDDLLPAGVYRKIGVEEVSILGVPFAL
jgi:hypothetical protein